jgi:hypothetical protein
MRCPICRSRDVRSSRPCWFDYLLFLIFLKTLPLSKLWQKISSIPLAIVMRANSMQAFVPNCIDHELSELDRPQRLFRFAINRIDQPVSEWRIVQRPAGLGTTSRRLTPCRFDDCFVTCAARQGPACGIVHYARANDVPHSESLPSDRLAVQVKGNPETETHRLSAAIESSPGSTKTNKIVWHCSHS